MNDNKHTAIKNTICGIFGEEAYENARSGLGNPSLEGMNKAYILYSVFYERMNESHMRFFLASLRQNLCFGDWIELTDQCAGHLKEHAYVEAIHSAYEFSDWMEVYNKSRNKEQEKTFLKNMKETASSPSHYRIIHMNVHPEDQEERYKWRKKTKDKAITFSDWNDVCAISEGKQREKPLWNMLLLSKSVEEWITVYNEAMPDDETTRKTDLELKRIRSQAIQNIEKRLPNELMTLLILARRPDDGLRNAILRKIETLNATMPDWVEAYAYSKKKEIASVMAIATQKIAAILEKGTLTA